ncbi:MAG: GIY-YIG nuclease family protein [Bacteroidales bacterium]|nr:GIY-YIG nuclease family protein [Bacteroidales bacterium]MCF8388520.1 GIY-YIG nuclease family protein [Bacteroidales bacterium]MCF8399530.1 GIY-YIG nuclease family protein [Bacteroidales bacterium]
MKTYYIYAIESQKEARIYVGFTGNLERRIKEHNGGKTRSTKAYRPWKLFFKKAVSSRAEARHLEKYYKSGCGKEFLKSLIRPRSSTG